MSDNLHAACVALGDDGVVIVGPSGGGKSDLALRLIDEGAILVSDDYVWVTAVEGSAKASPPPTIELLHPIRLRRKGVFVGKNWCFLEQGGPWPTIRMPQRAAKMVGQGLPYATGILHGVAHSGLSVATAPWDPTPLVLGHRMLQMVDHLKQHKGQLFYYLSLGR